MLFEIINPSDPYTMEAESLTAALGAVAILGEGRFGLEPIDNDSPKVPPILFGDWADEVYQAAGIDPPEAPALMAWMNASEANNEAVAKALDSVRLGGVKDRDKPRDPENANRSSRNDIGSFAWKYAEAMRGNRTFASVDVEAGN